MSISPTRGKCTILVEYRPSVPLPHTPSPAGWRDSQLKKRISALISILPVHRQGAFFISKIGGHHGQISEKYRSCAAYQRDAVSSNLSPRRTGSQNGQGVLHQDAQQPCYHARKWAVSLVFAEQGWQQCTRLSGKGWGHGLCLGGTVVECNSSRACFYSDG